MAQNKTPIDPILLYNALGVLQQLEKESLSLVEDERIEPLMESPFGKRILDLLNNIPLSVHLVRLTFNDVLKRAEGE